MAYVTTQFNYQVKTVQIDGGGEFQPLTSLLSTQGIIHRLTYLHTHHQKNEFVERNHKHVVQRAHTFASCIPTSKIMGSCFSNTNQPH